MSDRTPRVFSTAFKERAAQRLASGESATSLAAELGVRRKLLYDWHRAYAREGVAGLNRKRGPKPKTLRSAPSQRKPVSGDALSHAQARIAELERLVGQQQVAVTVTVYLTPYLSWPRDTVGLSRDVIFGLPHHVTQRGNRRTPTFFEEGDYALYLDLLAEAALRAQTEVWCYCLMPNHVHIVLVPSDTDGLRRTFGDLHRRYTGYVNARMRTTGHLWQGRFGSVAMDEAHLVHAARYVSLNPVRARLVARPEDWRWSSVGAHLAGEDDQVVKVAPLLDRVGDFAAFLGEDIDEASAYAALRKAETIGRPVGSGEWLADLEARTGRKLAAGRRGPKPASQRMLRGLSKLSP